MNHYKYRTTKTIKMTPEEEAKDLEYKFRSVLPYKGFTFDNEIKKYSKRCALICVEQIKKHLKSTAYFNDVGDGLKHYEQVAKEIKF